MCWMVGCKNWAHESSRGRDVEGALHKVEGVLQFKENTGDVVWALPVIDGI